MVCICTLCVGWIGPEGGGKGCHGPPTGAMQHRRCCLQTLPLCKAATHASHPAPPLMPLSFPNHFPSSRSFALPEALKLQAPGPPRQPHSANHQDHQSVSPAPPAPTQQLPTRLPNPTQNHPLPAPLTHSPPTHPPARLPVHPPPTPPTQPPTCVSRKGTSSGVLRKRPCSKAMPRSMCTTSALRLSSRIFCGGEGWVVHGVWGGWAGGCACRGRGRAVAVGCWG